MCVFCAVQSGEYVRAIFQVLPVIVPVILVYLMRLRRTQKKEHPTERSLQSKPNT